VAFIVLDNSPELGCIQWADLHISYKGTTYEVADGYTDNRYVWWDYSDPYHLQATNDLPALTDDDVLVFFNKNGTHLTVPNTTVVDGGLIVSESILADALAANCVTSVKILAGAISAEKIAASAIGAEKIAAGAVVSEKIAAGAVTASHISANGISANSITSGELLTALVKITGPAGYLRIDGDELVCYNQQGGAMGRFGYYEAFGDQIATFTRASTAYKQDGSQVASGVPRFEAVDGGRQGLTVEEGTTNLLTANQASVETDTTGFAPNGGATITRDGTQHWNGKYCLKVVTPGAGASEGFFCNVAMTAGETYTYSAYVRGSGTILLGIGDPDGTIYKWSDAITLTTTWTRYSVTITAEASGTAYIFVVTQTAQGITFYVDGLQVEQKPYATSWHLPGASRAAEVLTVPTANVFAKGSWAVEMEFTPTSAQVVAGRYASLWQCSIDANNFYILGVSPDGYLFAEMRSGGASIYIIDDTVLTGTTYKIMLSGQGGEASLCKNGAQVGTDTAYTEPVGVLPADMYIGSSGAGQANGLISDFRISSCARTLAEHQDAYNSGLPLALDECTTYLMNCDGHLRPTVRDYGLWSKNGRFVLQDPKAGQGIEVWDGATRKVLIGRLDDGRIGQEIVGGKLYSSRIRSGGKTSTSYIELAPGFEPLVVKENGKDALTIWAYGGGLVQFYDTNLDEMVGQILPMNDAQGKGIRIHGRNNTGNRKNVSIMGYEIYLDGDTGTVNYNGFTNFGGSKSNMEVTENYGKRLLAARESPENRYIDEGMGTLVDGTCVIQIDPIFLECIEPNTDSTPWLIHVTPYADIDLYIAEIGPDYFMVKERNGGTSNSRFAWSLSAVRQLYANIRLPEVLLCG